MKDKIYKYAPLIFLSVGLILFFITFKITGHCPHNRGLIWTIFIFIQMTGFIISGFLIKQLYLQVNTDTLTGLRNRRYFYTKLPKLRIKDPVSLILMDIDNFKNTNDTYGHIVGDQVLQQFAEILQNNTRSNDIISRWGGEEFAIILPQTCAKEAFKIADRIRKVVEDYVFTYQDVKCRITVSVGIASMKEGADVNMEQFVRVADEALYKAKEKKNSIVTVVDN